MTTERTFPPERCPTCHDAHLQFHALTVWCLRCGWARNRYPDPATGRPVENRP